MNWTCTPVLMCISITLCQVMLNGGDVQLTCELLCLTARHSQPTTNNLACIDGDGLVYTWDLHVCKPHFL